MARCRFSKPCRRRSCGTTDGCQAASPNPSTARRGSGSVLSPCEVGGCRFASMTMSPVSGLRTRTPVATRPASGTARSGDPPPRRPSGSATKTTPSPARRLTAEASDDPARCGQPVSGTSFRTAFQRLESEMSPCREIRQDGERLVGGCNTKVLSDPQPRHSPTRQYVPTRQIKTCQNTTEFWERSAGIAGDPRAWHHHDSRSRTGEQHGPAAESRLR